MRAVAASCGTTVPGPCVLCGQTDSELVHQGVRYDKHAQVWRCPGCGLVFLWPRPTPLELSAYYATAYAAEYEVGPIEERYRADVDEAQTRARRLRNLLGVGVRVLELGAGSGAFLEAVRPFAESVTGIEPDAAARRFIAERLGIESCARLEDLASDRRFDVIAMFHVLEHLPEPPASLQRVAERLTARGWIAIEVPNVDDALLTVYRVPGFSDFYFQKAHLYYFSSETLRSTLDLAGLEGTIEGLQRYDLSNHFRWMLTHAPGGQGYYASLFLPATDAAYADALIRSGHSDTLWAVCARAGTRGIPGLT